MPEHVNAAVRTANDLCRAYLRAIENRDVEAIVALLAPNAVSEFPFAPAGVTPMYHGAEAVREFLDLVIARLIDTIVINDLELTDVSDTVAFAEFTSDCRTKKGLAYQNRYIVKVVSDGDRIVLWREYFDPRATETVK